MQLAMGIMNSWKTEDVPAAVVVEDIAISAREVWGSIPDPVKSDTSAANGLPQLRRFLRLCCVYRRPSRSRRPPNPPIGGEPTRQKGPQIVLKDPKLHQFKNKILLCESR